MNKSHKPFAILTVLICSSIGKNTVLCPNSSCIQRVHQNQTAHTCTNRDSFLLPVWERKVCRIVLKSARFHRCNDLIQLRLAARRFAKFLQTDYLRGSRCKFGYNVLHTIWPRRVHIPNVVCHHVQCSYWIDELKNTHRTFNYCESFHPGPFCVGPLDTTQERVCYNVLHVHFSWQVYIPSVSCYTLNTFTRKVPTLRWKRCGLLCFIRNSSRMAVFGGLDVCTDIPNNLRRGLDGTVSQKILKTAHTSKARVDIWYDVRRDKKQ